MSQLLMVGLVVLFCVLAFWLVRFRSGDSVWWKYVRAAGLTDVASTSRYLGIVRRLTGRRGSLQVPSNPLGVNVSLVAESGRIQTAW